MVTHAEVNQFREECYVVLDGIEPAMLEAMRAAGEAATDRARRG